MFSSKRRSPPPPPAVAHHHAPQEAPSANRRGGRLVPSIISGDLIITGNLLSGGELQVDGTIDGDVRAASLVIGENAAVTGEVMGEEVVVRGRVVGSIRGIRVVLAANCHVEGEIFHESLAVEPGAFFEGNCRRSEDPLSRPEPEHAAAPLSEMLVTSNPAAVAPAAPELPQPAPLVQTTAPAPEPQSYHSVEAAPVIVKDGRVVVRRSAAE
ncbi:MAG: bactofilin family protein [Alphaproteobacteria bacterium]